MHRFVVEPFFMLTIFHGHFLLLDFVEDFSPGFKYIDQNFEASPVTLQIKIKVAHTNHFFLCDAL